MITTRTPTPTTSRPDDLPGWAVATIAGILGVIALVFGGALLVLWPVQSAIVLGTVVGVVAITWASVVRANHRTDGA